MTEAKPKAPATRKKTAAVVAVKEEPPMLLTCLFPKCVTAKRCLGHAASTVPGQTMSSLSLPTS